MSSSNEARNVSLRGTLYQRRISGDIQLLLLERRLSQTFPAHIHGSQGSLLNSFVENGIRRLSTEIEGV
jgi:hypothetical protein